MKQEEGEKHLQAHRASILSRGWGDIYNLKSKLYSMRKIESAVGKMEEGKEEEVL